MVFNDKTHTLGIFLMEFRDFNYTVYHKLKNERNDIDKELNWEQFIKRKDIGIVHTGIVQNYDSYKIVDEKKWTLAKIKYGI